MEGSDGGSYAEEDVDMTGEGGGEGGESFATAEAGDVTAGTSPDESDTHALLEALPGGAESTDWLPESVSFLASSREVGSHAVWALSGAKPGNGVAQLLDDELTTFWQSDGQRPHTITVQFHQRTEISGVALYLNHPADESYTPEVIRVLAGTTYHDLHQVHVVRVQNPHGWLVVPTSDPTLAASHKLLRRRSTHYSAAKVSFPVRAVLLQIEVMCMHQNGRDTRIRGMKVFSPRHRPLPYLGPGSALGVPAAADIGHGGGGGGGGGGSTAGTETGVVTGLVTSMSSRREEDSTTGGSQSSSRVAAAPASFRSQRYLNLSYSTTIR